MKLLVIFILSTLLACCNAGHKRQKHKLKPTPPLITHSTDDNETTPLGEAYSTPLPPKRMNGVVVFRDDFNTLNHKDWKNAVRMNGLSDWHFEMYTNDRKNTYVKNGYLYVKPTLTVDDPRFSGPNFLTTGVVDMKKLFGYCSRSQRMGCYRNGKIVMIPPTMSSRLDSIPTLKYGIVDVRARISTGDWLRPAIWMMPKNDKYGKWPRSGEIDIMESWGNSGRHGVGKVTSHLIFGPSWDKWYPIGGARKSANWAKEFHVWRLEWSPTHIAMYVDNKRKLYAEPGNGGFWKKGHFKGDNIWVNGTSMAPFDDEFYLILNVSVGGGFPVKKFKNRPWSHNWHSQKDFWAARKKWLKTWKGDDVAMLVDYVEFRQW